MLSCMSVASTSVTRRSSDVGTGSGAGRCLDETEAYRGDATHIELTLYPQRRFDGVALHPLMTIENVKFYAYIGYVPNYKPIMAETLDCHEVSKGIACGRCNSR